ncbi:hypothetical protein BC830DRAFT_769460 [Chytriomyces sp. MP71]|nr:hypothetical protein BC830DRAFT_769460 [Chytriomyces sp. MP71]
MSWTTPAHRGIKFFKFDIAFNELETYLSDSVGIHFICFISNKRGSPATLPRFISITLFETILASIADVGGQQSANFIRKWYKIDENKRPPKYSLLPISAVIQDFLADIKTKAFRNAKEEWMYCNEEPSLTSYVFCGTVTDTKSGMARR